MKAPLTNQNIDLAIDEVRNFYNNQKVDRKEVTALLLRLEEALSQYQKAFGEDTVFTLDCGRFLNSYKVKVRIEGEMFDPFSPKSDDYYDTFLQGINSRVGNLPRWSYGNQKNTLSFVIGKTRIPDYLKLIIAIAGGLFLGVMLRLVNEPLGLTLQAQIFEPIGNTIIGLINVFAILMVFFSIIWGIYSMGDANTFSVMGRKLTLKLLLYMVVSTVFVTVCSLIVLQPDFGQTSTEGAYFSLLQILLDIFPKNFFTAFTEGNTLQILILGMIVGISMIFLGEKAQRIALNIEQLNLLVQDIMKIIGKLIYIYIFCSMFNVIATSQIEILKNGGAFLIISVIGFTLILIFHLLSVMIKLRCSPIKIWKKAAKPFFIAFATSSSAAAMAAMSANIKTAIEAFHIKERFARFGVPFTTLLYKPASACLFVMAAISTATGSHTPISVLWVITAIVMSIILSAAIPPVAGGLFANLILIFTQLGLPQENMPVIATISVILDFYSTGVNVFTDECLLLNAAHTFGMIENNMPKAEH